VDEDEGGEFGNCGVRGRGMTDSLSLATAYEENLNMIFIRKSIPYRAVNSLRLGYKNQSVNVVWGNNRSLFSDPHKTQIHCVGRTWNC
jgi:hypothetical protein